MNLHQEIQHGIKAGLARASAFDHAVELHILLAQRRVRLNTEIRVNCALRDIQLQEHHVRQDLEQGATT